MAMFPVAVRPTTNPRSAMMNQARPLLPRKRITPTKKKTSYRAASASTPETQRPTAQSSRRTACSTILDQPQCCTLSRHTGTAVWWEKYQTRRPRAIWSSPAPPAIVHETSRLLGNKILAASMHPPRVSFVRPSDGDASTPSRPSPPRQLPTIANTRSGFSYLPRHVGHPHRERQCNDDAGATSCCNGHLRQQQKKKKSDGSYAARLRIPSDVLGGRYA